MIITTKCPGCNAPIQVEDNVTSLVCQFCGAHFDVNLNDVSPAFHKADDPSEPAPEPSAPEPLLPKPSAYPYNPPIPGETPAATIVDLYNPAIPNPAGTGYPPTQPPPPFYTPPASPPGGLSGARLWIVIGVVVLAAFCMTCLCLTVFVYRFIR